NKSKYCSRSTIRNEFEYLIKNAQFKYLFLSYNNEGLMSIEEIKTIMEKYGYYDFVSKEYQRFKSDKDGNRNYLANETEEYLHILIKN
ncbi:MAG: modification methylase, partial [Treponema sp.]|nr:modification methylase [Treponema sp.]